MPDSKPREHVVEILKARGFSDFDLKSKIYLVEMNYPTSSLQTFYKDRLADGWKFFRVEHLCREAGIPSYKMQRAMKKKIVS